jgi:hypothetical protein
MVGRWGGGDALLSASGGLAEAGDVGTAAVVDVGEVGLNTAGEALGVPAVLDVSEVDLGGNDGGRGGGEEDGETHIDWSFGGLRKR